MLRKYVKEVYKLSFRQYSTAEVAFKNEKNKISPLISCKRTEFNLYENDVNSKKMKFGEIPLASSGWKHYKSKGDYFILHPTISSSDHHINNVTNSFENLELSSEIIENLRTNHNILKPTNIQSETIPKILDGNHVLIAAETGVGKTLAFLLPIIQQILQEKAEVTRNFNTPLALILTPGRELAAQIGTIAEQFADDFNLKIKVILGGRTKQLMMNPSFEDVDLLIGTIGAVSKLVTTGIYRMQQVRHVVLDEADTLLDDSFNDKLGYFLKRFPFHKNHLQDLSENIVGTQLILASATMPTNIEELLGNIVNTKTICEVVSTNLHKLLTHVPQRFLRMNKSDRPIQLLNLLKADISKKRPVIVFGNKSVTSDFISLFLNDRGIECVNLNGDMLMKIRVGQFEKFQNGEVNVLATTDIGSRGLDTTRALHIINFDFPLHVADYIHRCGRAGRVGSSNDCLITNFVSSEREIDLVQKIEHVARSSLILPNVNANITNIIKKNIAKQIEDELKTVLK